MWLEAVHPARLEEELLLENKYSYCNPVTSFTRICGFYCIYVCYVCKIKFERLYVKIEGPDIHLCQQADIL